MAHLRLPFPHSFSALCFTFEGLMLVVEIKVITSKMQRTAEKRMQKLQVALSFWEDWDM